MSPAPGFPPQWYGLPGPCPGGGQGLHYHSTIATTIITPTTPTTPRAPRTTTNAAATTDYCCCCCCYCGYCCCYYYDYYYILLYDYILCLFLLPLLLPLLNPTMYVHMYAPTTGHRGGGIPWRGEGGTSEAWLIYTIQYTHTSSI